jgi:hypothetical protein
MGRFGNFLATNRLAIFRCHFLIRNASVAFRSVRGSTREATILLGLVLVFKAGSLNRSAVPPDRWDVLIGRTHQRALRGKTNQRGG